jgi:hypothetical protein
MKCESHSFGEEALVGKKGRMMRRRSSLDLREEHEMRKPQFWGRSFGWQKGKDEMMEKKKKKKCHRTLLSKRRRRSATAHRSLLSKILIFLLLTEWCVWYQALSN